MPPALTTLKGITVGEKRSFRWDKAAKQWFTGTVTKLRLKKEKKSKKTVLVPQAFAEFREEEEDEDHWIVIKRGWHKLVEGVDSDEEESAAEEEEVAEEPAPKKKRARKTEKKKTEKKKKAKGKPKARAPRQSKKATPFPRWTCLNFPKDQKVPPGKSRLVRMFPVNKYRVGGDVTYRPQTSDIIAARIMFENNHPCYAGRDYLQCAVVKFGKGHYAAPPKGVEAFV